MAPNVEEMHRRMSNTDTNTNTPEKGLALRIYNKALSNSQAVGRFPLHFGIDPWAINSTVLMLQVGGQQIHTTYGELIGVMGRAVLDVLSEDFDGKATKASGV